ncbi:hypothetical protein BGZ94_000751, partial [Podila epigama]
TTTTTKVITTTVPVTTTTVPVTTTTVPVTTTVTPIPTGSCSAPAWNAGTAYGGGSTVSYNGRTYTAKWWTQGDVPSASGSPWTDNGLCSGPQPTGTPGCSGTPAWNAATAYNSGATVTYNGYIYTAQWWTKDEAPGSNSVWVRGSACSGSSNKVKRMLYNAARFQ